MRKGVSTPLIVLLILVVLTLALQDRYAEGVKYDFRKINWGMSKGQVKATEGKEPDSETNTTVAYKVEISGDDYICGYTFLEDKLYNSGYVFIGGHTNENLYIDDYGRLKGILTKKYGRPETDEITWIDDLFKDDRSVWGFAISIGDLSYRSTWETPTTYITLRLWGDNYEIDLVLAYDSRELKGWADKIISEKEESIF